VVKNVLFFYLFNYQLFVFSFLEFAFLSSFRCSGKIQFFSQFTETPPSVAHGCKRPSKLSSQCERTLLLAGNFLYNQKQPSASEGDVANFQEFLEKNSIFNEHSIVCYCYLNCWFLKSLDIQRLLVLIDMRNWCGMEMERNKINTTSAPWQHGYESFRAFKKL